MAYLKGRKNSSGITFYLSRISMYKEGGKDIHIGLGTSDYKVAMERHQEVEDKERALKEGMSFEWSWKNVKNRGRAKIVSKTIRELIDEWLEIKKISIRVKSYDRYCISMDRFTDIVGNTAPPKSINNKSITDFKKYYQGKHTRGGINVNLRGIKCFLLWCLDEGHITKMPKIEMMREDKSKPKAINEGQWKAIMRDDMLNDWWKNVFRVYKQTGIRLSEGVLGELVGNFLIVSAENSKTKMEREIPLTENQVSIIEKIQLERDNALDKGTALSSFKNRFTRQFNRVCLRLGIEGLSFHSLRHTFAVRRYLETRDLYAVCKELGHTSIKTTEIYSQFSFARLEQDYPSLVRRLANSPKIEVLDAKKVDAKSYQFYNPPREMN